jgi:hypothetical protein
MQGRISSLHPKLMILCYFVFATFATPPGDWGYCSRFWQTIMPPLVAYLSHTAGASSIFEKS